MNLNEWAMEIHKNAVEHGWWEGDRGLPEILMLIVSELSEALEESRAGRPMEWHGCMLNQGNPCMQKELGCEDDFKEETCTYCMVKPEGIAVEVIDALIRILDWCGKVGIDVERLVREKHEYNKTRAYKHGKLF